MARYRDRTLRYRPAELLLSAYRKPGIHEFLPFSSGAHRCIGSA